MNFVMAFRSYDIKTFNILIDRSPDWSCIIASHIHLDRVLSCFLEEFCVRPKSVSSGGRRMNALDKAAFLHGVGVLSDGSLHVVNLLNKLRNKFAHELNFEVSDDRVSEYRSTLISEFGDRVYSREEYQKSTDGKLDFKLMLKLSVLFVEEERLAHLKMGLMAEKSRAELEDTIRSVRISNSFLGTS